MRVVFFRRWRWVVPERRGRTAVVFGPGPALVRRCCGELAVAEGVARRTTREELDRCRQASSETE